MTLASDLVREGGPLVVPVVEGAAIGWVAEVELFGASTAVAAASVVLLTLVAGMAAGRRVALAAGAMAAFLFGDHHLAGPRGVMGTPMAAWMVVLVLALAGAAAVLGDRWRRSTT